MHILDKVTPSGWQGKVKIFLLEDDPSLCDFSLGDNAVCVGFYDCVQNLMMRNFDEWQPAYISLGAGGDFNQPADPESEAPSDQGTRIAPAFLDTYVRKPFYSAPIVQVKESDIKTERRFHYVAILRPEEAITLAENSDRPFINEFGLLAQNGTLLAHYVPEAVGGGAAKTFQKSRHQWLVVDWEINFSGEDQ